MPTPAFDPNSTYAPVTFNPSASYDAAPQHDFSSLTANPKGEGTYQIKTQDGQTVAVPYSNVPVFTQGLQGSSFATPEDQARFEKDAAADPKRPTFWNALTNPVGSGGRDQGPVGGALQVGGQAIKAMAAPFTDPGGTVKGMAKAVVQRGGPHDFAADMQAKAPDALAVENATGQVLGGIEGGRVMGAAVAPVAAAVGNVAGRAVLLGKTPEGAYESALKPSTTLSPADRASVVQTGLENAIPVSKGGLEKIGGLIDDYNQKIKDTIAADPNRPISPLPALGNLRSVRAKFANQVNPTADVDAVNAAGNEFASNFRPGGNYPQGTMPADAAQAMKQGTYSVLKGKFGEQGSASVEAQKALARGLKEEIATQFPEINDLNAAESKLFDLEPVLERAVNRTANHQLIGIGTPIAGAAAKAVTGSGGAGVAASVLKSVLDNPAVKSRLAIAVSKAQKIPFSQASARVQAYSSALGSVAPGAQEYSSADTPNQ